MFTNDTPHSRVMDKDKTITRRPLSDMESDGVYFPEDVKKELTDLREKEHCHYSGLPSMEWYRQNSKSSTDDTDVIELFGIVK